jgi:hypothetical protein
LKGINLYAIDRNWKYGAPTVGLDAGVLITDGDFELSEPTGASWARRYAKHRAVSVVFDDLHDLVTKLGSFKGFVAGPKAKPLAKSELGPLEAGGIQQLVMICHGSPGVLFVNGVDEHGNSGTFLAPSTLSTYSSDLKELGKYLAADATVRFDGCNAGSDTYEPSKPRGTDLLIALSKLWPGIRVVAFTDYGIGQETDSSPHRFVAAEDSDIHYPEPEPAFTPADALKGSWRSEYSPHARIARDGAITKQPAPDVLRNQYLSCPMDQPTIRDDDAHGHCGAKSAPGHGAAAPPGTNGWMVRPVPNRLKEFVP